MQWNLVEELYLHDPPTLSLHRNIHWTTDQANTVYMRYTSGRNTN